MYSNVADKYGKFCLCAIRNERSKCCRTIPSIYEFKGKGSRRCNLHKRFRWSCFSLHHGTYGVGNRQGECLIMGPRPKWTQHGNDVVKNSCHHLPLTTIVSAKLPRQFRYVVELRAGLSFPFFFKFLLWNREINILGKNIFSVTVALKLYTHVSILSTCFRWICRLNMAVFILNQNINISNGLVLCVVLEWTDN